MYVVPTEFTDHTEAYGLKLFESTEWPTLREARIHRNECLRQTMGIILLVVLLYVVPTEYTEMIACATIGDEPCLTSATLHKLSILCLLSYDAQRLYALCIPKP